MKSSWLHTHTVLYCCRHFLLMVPASWDPQLQDGSSSLLLTNNVGKNDGGPLLRCG